MTEYEQLLKARALLKERRYDDARSLLKALPNNPQARAWLAKLDTVAPIKKRHRSLALPVIALLLLGGLTATAALIQRGNSREVILPTEARLPVVVAPTNTQRPTNSPLPTNTHTRIPTNTPLPSATWTPVPTDTPLPPTATSTSDPNALLGNNGLTFRIEGYESHEQIDSEASLWGVFVTILGSLENRTDAIHCLGWSDFDLQIQGDSIFSGLVSDRAMKAAHITLYPDRNSRECLRPDETEPYFVTFEVSFYKALPATFFFADASIPLTYSWAEQSAIRIAELTAAPTLIPPSLEDQVRQIVLNTSGVRIRYEDIRTLVVNERTVTLMYYVQDSYGGPDFLKDQFADDSLYLICAFRSAGYWSQNFAFAGRADFIDSYGNSSENKAIQIEVSAATAGRINCNNLGGVDIFDVAETVWMHPAIR